MPRTPLVSVFALFAAASGSIAAAQTAAPGNVVTPAPPPREGTVGPEQLRDFALPGTRAQTPTTTPTPTPAPTPTPTPAPAPGGRTNPAPTATAPARTAPAGEAPAARAETSATREANEPAASPAPSVPATPAPASDAAAPGPVFDVPVTVTPSMPPSDAASPSPGGSGTFGWWPWLLVAAAAGVLLALLLRQRRRPVPAGRYLADEDAPVPVPQPTARPAPAARMPTPQPQPQPRLQPEPAADPRPALPPGIVTTRVRAQPAPPAAVPAPVPAALPPVPAGAVVSTRLRPWIDLELAVREIEIDEAEAVLRFDLQVRNDGAASARQIVIEAVALNAGETQGEELARFFARPMGSDQGIEELAPLGTTMVSHELRLRREAIRLYALGGRETFVPVVAFNATYRLASGDARTSAAWLVGRAVPGAERLGPLPIAAGTSRLGGIGVRRLAEAVRR